MKKAEIRYIKGNDTLVTKCVLLYFTLNRKSHLTYCIFEVHKPTGVLGCVKVLW